MKSIEVKRKIKGKNHFNFAPKINDPTKGFFPKIHINLLFVRLHQLEMICVIVLIGMILMLLIALDLILLVNLLL